MSVPPRPSAAHVVVVGSINVDLVVTASRLPVAGETVMGGRFARHQGGKGGNQAVAAARLGAAVTIAAAAGDDEFGRAALADLAAEDVDISHVHVQRTHPTGVALIVVDETGENQIAVAPGANTALTPAVVEAVLSAVALGPGDCLLGSFELAVEAVAAAARLAANRGTLIVINPAPAQAIPNDLLALAPILVPNAGEAEALTGERDPIGAARALAEMSRAPVIVTLGADGALVVSDAGVERVAAPRVAAVDTTGAGDTFAGALAAELAAGSHLVDAARVAVRAASLAVTAAGARAGMPTRAQLEAAGG